MKLLFTAGAFMFLFAGSTFANDYPGMKPEHVKVIMQLEAGVEKDALKLAQRTADFPWRLYVPDLSDAQESLPLVVFLHGAGRRGDDNVGAMDLAWSFITPEAQQANPCFVLAGQVPKGRSWTPILKAREKILDQGQDIEITEEMTALLTVVDRLIEERPIDATRVYVVGQSMGGYGSWDALQRRPNLWAAAVPICGGGSSSKVAAYKHVPIWAWHGAKDTVVSVENTREMIEALKAAGGEPRYTELPKVGHGAWGPALSDPELIQWLFDQKKEAAPSE